MVFVDQSLSTEVNDEFGESKTCDGNVERKSLTKEVLLQHGAITKALKLRMLKEWSTGFVSEEDAMLVLQAETLRFIGDRTNSKVIDTNTVFAWRAIWAVRTIPDDSWMRFVRLNLKLSEDVIERVKLKGKLTEEQKHQIANFAMSN
ncbi:uncharacterized protein LOC144427152 [Styela clava]